MENRDFNNQRWKMNSSQTRRGHKIEGGEWRLNTQSGRSFLSRSFHFWLSLNVILIFHFMGIKFGFLKCL